LGLETHVQHAISLIEHEVLDVLKRDAASLYEVHQSTGSSNKQIAATLDLSELGANVGTTVNDTRSNPRTVGELAGLVENLRHKLTGRGKDQRGGISLALATKLTGGISGHGRRTVEESLREDGEQETTSLSRTGLGTSHQITTVANDGDRVLLDRCRDLVVGELDVAAQMFIQRGGGELVNRLRHVGTGSLNGDVVVLLEVDTGVLLGRIVGSGTEELALDTGVSRTGNVLSVSPLSITRSASSGSAAARVAVEVAATTVATTSTAPATSAVVVLVGRDVVAPIVLASTVVLVSPGTVAETVGTRAGRRTTVHSGGTTLGTTLRRTATAAHVRRDVGSVTLGRALLGAIVEGEATHVDLIGHVDSRVSDRENCRKIVGS
jgi:hypothetical protein